MDLLSWGDPFVPSSEGQGKISLPGPRRMEGLRFWLEGLVERLDMMYVRELVWPAVQG